jgi:formylglycine-generating enzyme required for sulfatase activity
MCESLSGVVLCLTSLLAVLSGLPVRENELKAPQIADAKGIKSKTVPSLKLVRIAARGKTFTMGSPPGEKDRDDDEIEHQVTLSADYYLGVMAVTRGQFRQFIQDADYKTEAEADGKGGHGYDAEKRTVLQAPRYSWKDAGFYQDDDHPVVNVSWNDAQAFCKWLSEKDGKEYRLPTEAEWEFACRAGTTTRFYFGNDDSDLGQFANVADKSLKAKWDSNHKNKEYQKRITAWLDRVTWDDAYPFTAPVGKFKPNRFGLYDMQGNVWQWCGDWYGNYPTEAVTDPRGPDTGSERVRRGGSWSGDAHVCRSANRFRAEPTFRSNLVGFRVAIVVEEKPRRRPEDGTTRNHSNAEPGPRNAD